jgi:hypothetical protein
MVLKSKKHPQSPPTQKKLNSGKKIPLKVNDFKIILGFLAEKKILGASSFEKSRPKALKIGVQCQVRGFALSLYIFGQPQIKG